MRYKDMSNKPYSCETCVHNTKEWYELPCDACCAAHCGYVKREEGGRMSDLISRQAAIDGFYEMASDIDHLCTVGDYISFLESLSAQPEIIRCKDCRWWDKYGDGTHGYCMAAKHGHWSTHWEISIRRTYDGDWFCADAERRTDADTEV